MTTLHGQAKQVSGGLDILSQSWKVFTLPCYLSQVLSVPAMCWFFLSLPTTLPDPHPNPTPTPTSHQPASPFLQTAKMV